MRYVSTLRVCRSIPVIVASSDCRAVGRLHQIRVLSGLSLRFVVKRRPRVRQQGPLPANRPAPDVRLMHPAPHLPVQGVRFPGKKFVGDGHLPDLGMQVFYLLFVHLRYASYRGAV
jgi:hypothetical protein